MRLTRVHVLLGLALLLVFVGTLLLRPTQRSAGITFYVSSQDGLDSRSCDQARNAGTPKASINGGNACLHGGDTLMIAPGNYDELVLGQTSSSTTCHSGDAAVQTPCHAVPNGLSASQPTRLIGSGTETILSPAGRQLPGGGSAMTLHDQVRYVHIEGFNIVRNAAPGSKGGIYTANVQHVTLKGNTLDDGQIKSGVYSQHVHVIGNHIFNTGKKDCPPDVKPTPSSCPHGLYMCGTDHIITDNYVHDTSYYSIQVSCEQGGIARIRIERNRVENSPVVGIRCAGTDCIVGANLLLNNGLGITVGGSGSVSNNVVHGYFRAPWDQDPWGIYGSLGGYAVTNNIVTAQKNSQSMINNDLQMPDPAKVHHNMGDLTGNPGVTLIAPASGIYTSVEAKNFTLKDGSPALGAGVPTPVTAGIHGVPYPTPPDLGAYSSASAPAPPADTQPPQVTLTNPPPNESVFDQLPLRANASDNVAVVGVQFLVDNVVYGQEVTSAPYEVTFVTTAYPNGNHTFTARARDAAGLSTTAPARTLVISNPVPPEPPTPPSGAVVLKCAGKVDGANLVFACTKP